MAIYTYDPGSSVADLTALKTFLESHKSDTFLKNIELIIGTSGSLSKLTFSNTVGGTEELISIFAGNSLGSGPYSYITFGTSENPTYYNFTYGAWQSSNNWFRVRKVVLCSNGLIVLNDWADNYRDSMVRTAVAITHDENNHMVGFAVRSYIGGMRYDDVIAPIYLMCSGVSISYNVYVTPSTNLGYTSMSEMSIGLFDGSTQKIKCAFVPTSVQTATINFNDIYTTTIGSKTYITNGLWWIED